MKTDNTTIQELAVSLGVYPPKPLAKEKAEARRSAADCSPSSATPKTAAAWSDCIDWLNNRDEVQDPQHVALANLAEDLENEKNFWRNEHDRVVREYQHRLMVLATSAIESTNYPENDQADLPATVDSALRKDVTAG